MDCMNSSSTSQCAISATTKDFYICYGTIPNYASLRDSQQGSWFIQAFVQILAMHSHNKEFDDLMRLVQTRLYKIGQENNVLVQQSMSYEKRGSTKKFYLNPGLYGTIKRKASEDPGFDNQKKPKVSAPSALVFDCSNALLQNNNSQL